MHKIILGLILGLFLPIYSQTQSWMGLELSIKPIKRTKIEIGVQHRMVGLGQWNRTFIQEKFQFKVVPGVSLFASHRLGIFPNSNSALDLKTRAYSNRISLGMELNPWEWINPKSRFVLGIANQMQWNQYKFRRPSVMLRTRINVKYDINNFPLSPFISWEHFYDLKRDITYMESEVIIDGGTTAFRSFGGIEIEISKKQSLDLSVGRRKNYLNDQRTWIINLNYSLRLN